MIGVNSSSKFSSSRSASCKYLKISLSNCVPVSSQCSLIRNNADAYEPNLDLPPGSNSISLLRLNTSLCKKVYASFFSFVSNPTLCR